MTITATATARPHFPDQALALLARGELGAGLSDSTQLRPAKNVLAYESPSRFPVEARPHQVYVDAEAESGACGSRVKWLYRIES